MDSLLMRQHLELEESHWWFVARRRILLKILERNLGSRRNLDILDAGCGGGATMESLRRYGHARGMELSEEMVDFNKRQGRDVVEGSIERMPFADEGFDLALALDVIEHVPDDLLALGELFRVLKPGGSLLVTVPALQILWSRHDEANGHFRRYALGELLAQTQKAGFETVRASYFNTVLFPAVFAVRMLGRLRPKNTAASDVSEVPQPLNRLLTRIFSLEAPLLGSANGRARLPFGVSALCLVRKPERGGA